MGRAQTEEYGPELKINIPSKKNILLVLFLCAWMGGWLMGEIFAVRELFSEETSTNAPDLFLIFWLCGWTLGGAFVLCSILWNIMGKEIVTLSDTILKIEKKVLA